MTSDIAPSTPQAAGLPALSTDLRAILIADVRGYTRFMPEHGDAPAAQLAARFRALVPEGVEP